MVILGKGPFIGPLLYLTAALWGLDSTTEPMQSCLFGKHHTFRYQVVSIEVTLGSHPSFYKTVLKINIAVKRSRLDFV